MIVHNVMHRPLRTLITMIAVAALLLLSSKNAVNARWLVPLAALYAIFIAVITLM